MPDKENTFVLKADGATEYLIEAKDAMDMKSWIATIRYCMKTTPTSQMPSHSLDVGATPNPMPNTSLISSTGSIAETSTSAACAPSSSNVNTPTTGATLNNNNVNSVNNNRDYRDNQASSSSQPEIPPRRPEALSQFHLAEDDLEHESDLTSQMNEYPW